MDQTRCSQRQKRVTDADDRFAVAGDDSLGPARAIDCDAFDPRVAPVSSAEKSNLPDGTVMGVGVRAIPGGWDDDPLSIYPGTLWGPCDGEARSQTVLFLRQCGGPLPYTEALAKCISNTYSRGEDLRFKGMCFPVCAIP